MKYAIVFAVLLGAVVRPVVGSEEALPRALMEAKTVAVHNTGNVDQKFYEEFVAEVRALKRFELVDEPAADVTIVLDAAHVMSSSNVARKLTAVHEYRMSFTRGATVLYSDRLQGCCSFKAEAHKTLDKLNKRMTEQAANPR